MHSICKRFAPAVLLLCAAPLVVAQTYLCGPPETVAKPCSYTAMNQDCDLLVDRLRPLTPPTIYLRRDRTVTVHIAHVSPFEQLSMDLKSATSVTPPDAFSAILGGLSPTLGKFSFVGLLKPHTGEQLAKDKIKQDQDALLNALQAPLDQAAAAFALIKPATQPPPGDVCFGKDDPQSPWLHTANWIAAVDQSLSAALKVTLPQGNYLNRGTSFDTSAATGQIKTLDGEIAKLTSPADATADEIAALKANQGTLSDAVKALDKALTKLRNLKKVIDAVPVPETAAGKAFLATQTPKAIIDLQAQPGAKGKMVLADKDDLNEQWSLDFVNTLLPAVKGALADPLDSIQGALADIGAGAPQKTSLVTITAAYQTPPRIEVSTGLMVPMQPYHAYASAEAATNGTVTGYVVQESLTYTVIPDAQVNFVLKDWVAKRQRVGLFGSVAVGYNPSTSSVEFGFGPSFSWRSILVSGLLDVGRDLQLADGFKVGQSLGTSSSAKPLTSTVWEAKPAVGIGIRIPLGGSGGK